MIKHHLPKKAIYVWNFRSTVILCISSFICGAVGIFDLNFSYIFLTLTLLSYVYSIFFYIPKKYAVQKYAITKNKIYIEKGVYFKTKTTIPTNKIQNIEIKIRPDENFWKLSTIIFSSAGIKISISQIPYQKALYIRENLNFEDKHEI